MPISLRWVQFWIFFFVIFVELLMYIMKYPPFLKFPVLSTFHFLPFLWVGLWLLTFTYLLSHEYYRLCIHWKEEERRRQHQLCMFPVNSLMYQRLQTRRRSRYWTYHRTLFRKFFLLFLSTYGSFVYSSSFSSNILVAILIRFFFFLCFLHTTFSIFCAFLSSSSFH